jgi:Fe2+ or Zn2+ uptake regulation protein
MKFNFVVKEDNVEYMADTFSALKNPTALKILLILESKSLSLDEVHEQLKKEKTHKYRDWTYRILEKLVEAKLIQKNYSNEAKKIRYSKK